METNRIVSFSYIRAIACITIIVLHNVFSAILIYGNQISMQANIISRIIVNNCMWAVPCFVMVTGALLLNPQKEIPIEKIFKKYIFRILMALILFTFIFQIFDVIMNKESLSISVLIVWMQKLFTATSWSHLWYLYLLIGLYLLLPFYRMIVKGSSEKEMTYLLIVYILFLSLLPLLNTTTWKTGFYIHESTIYPFYLFAGYYLLNRKNLKLYTIGLILSTICIGCLTYIRWMYAIEWLENLWTYSSILVIIQSICFYGMMISMKPVMNKVLLSIDTYSFGIYLIHMVGVRLILRYWNFNPYIHMPMVSFIGIIIGILAGSYGVIRILHCIPQVKKII